MTVPAPSYCLATVADASFARGVEVLLSSFLQHNPWFLGDLVVFTDDASARPLQPLKAFPRLTLRPVSAELAQRLDAVTRRLPQLRGRRARFYSLEAFSLHGYDRVLFLDADMVCRGTLKPLFETEGAFVACPDRSLHEGMARDARTYAKVDPAAARVLATPFNAGMMRFDRVVLDGPAYARLLDSIRPEVLLDVRSGHTDQFLLNRLFDGAVTWADARYNHLVTTGVRPDAVLVHLLGRPKPWQTRLLSRARHARRRQWAPWYAAAVACDRQRLHRRPGLRAALRYLYSRLLLALASR